MVDVDHFKRLNDTHGHDGGDALLAAFGRLLARNVRAEEIPYRYGGDECCLILPGAGLELTRRRAEAIRDAVREMAVRHNGRQLGPVPSEAGGPGPGGGGGRSGHRGRPASEDTHAITSLPERPPGPTASTLPSGLARGPFLCDHYGYPYEVVFLNGFVGVRQEADKLRLRPDVGRAIRGAAAA